MSIVDLLGSLRVVLVWITGVQMLFAYVVVIFVKCTWPAMGHPGHLRTVHVFKEIISLVLQGLLLGVVWKTWLHVSRTRLPMTADDKYLMAFAGIACVSAAVGMLVGRVWSWKNSGVFDPTVSGPKPLAPSVELDSSVPVTQEVSVVFDVPSVCAPQVAPASPVQIPALTFDTSVIVHLVMADPGPSDWGSSFVALMLTFPAPIDNETDFSLRMLGLNVRKWGQVVDLRIARADLPRDFECVFGALDAIAREAIGQPLRIYDKALLRLVRKQRVSTSAPP